jgi:hypothetical protein
MEVSGSPTPRPFYPLGKSSRYQFDRSIGRPQSRSGRGGEEKKSHTLSVPGVSFRLSSLYTDWATLASCNKPLFYAMYHSYWQSQIWASLKVVIILYHYEPNFFEIRRVVLEMKHANG